VYLVGVILRGVRCGKGNLNVGTSSNGRMEGRMKMEPTTGCHAYDDIDPGRRNLATNGGSRDGDGLDDGAAVVALLSLRGLT